MENMFEETLARYLPSLASHKLHIFKTYGKPSDKFKRNLLRCLIVRLLKLKMKKQWEREMSLCL